MLGHAGCPDAVITVAQGLQRFHGTVAQTLLRQALAWTALAAHAEGYSLTGLGPLAAPRQVPEGGALRGSRQDRSQINEVSS